MTHPTSKKLTRQVVDGMRIRHAAVENASDKLAVSRDMAYLSHLDRAELLGEVERLRAALAKIAAIQFETTHVSEAKGIAIRALQGSSDETSPDPLDYKLPCEVRIPPSTSFGKGVTLRALMHGLRSREGQPDEVTRFHDERAKAIRNALRFTDASLEKLCQCDPGPAFGQVCNTCGGIKGFTQETSRELRDPGDDALPLRRPTADELERILDPNEHRAKNKAAGCDCNSDSDEHLIWCSIGALSPNGLVNGGKE